MGRRHLPVCRCLPGKAGFAKCLSPGFSAENRVAIHQGDLKKTVTPGSSQNHLMGLHLENLPDTTKQAVSDEYLSRSSLRMSGKCVAEPRLSPALAQSWAAFMRCSTMHRLGNTLASWTAVRLLGDGFREHSFASVKVPGPWDLSIWPVNSLQP